MAFTVKLVLPERAMVSDGSAKGNMLRRYRRFLSRGLADLGWQLEGRESVMMLAPMAEYGPIAD